MDPCCCVNMVLKPLSVPQGIQGCFDKSVNPEIIVLVFFKDFLGKRDFVNTKTGVIGK